MSEEMWNKLEEILPFKEKCNIEMELEAQLATLFKTLSTIKIDTEFESCLISIVSVTTKLSELQQSQYAFYTTAEELARLNFYEQAKEILDQTILSGECSEIYLRDEAAILLTNILWNKNSSSDTTSSDTKRKDAQDIMKYVSHLGLYDLRDIKRKFGLIGIAMGDENLFQDLIPAEESIDASVDLEVLYGEIWTKAFGRMAETVYLCRSGEENKMLRAENQQLREELSRLEAELARNNASNTELPAYANHATTTSTATTTSNKTTSDAETEPQEKLEMQQQISKLSIS